VLIALMMEIHVRGAPKLIYLREVGQMRANLAAITYTDVLSV